MKYDYNTFKQLFDSHIHYAYEHKHGCSIGDDSHYCEYAVFHKLYINSDGILNYKGNVETYDPRLWPKVKLLVEILTETPAEKILFKTHDEEEQS